MKGKVHSFQSLGTLDGPGIRSVVFMHGCNLHCGYCHNIDVCKGEYTEFGVDELISKIIKFKEYFGENGGVTVSGGEPLLQAEFVLELFKKCREYGINTALDTSGSILNDEVRELLEYTDLVLLDIKMTNDEDYIKYIGCSMDKPLEFLKYLSLRNIDVWIRNVVVSGLNDTAGDILKLKEICNSYNNIKRIDLLPFKKVCKTKYDLMNIKFEFDRFNETPKEKIDELNKLI